MLHTVTVNFVADQEIKLLGKYVNIYDLQTIFVESDGRIVNYKIASQQSVEADSCVWCRNAPVKGDRRKYCHNCGRKLPLN